MSLRIVDDEKKRMAVHESGHVAVAVLLKDSLRLVRVTIAPQNGLVGTVFMADDDKYAICRADIISAVRLWLGGVVAEELILGSLCGDKVSNDVAKAVIVAEKMVRDFGIREPVEILESEKEFVRFLLERNKKAVDILVERLMDKETLSGEEAQGIFKEFGADKPGSVIS
jgi:ATP-dependent Zn protease